MEEGEWGCTRADLIRPAAVEFASQRRRYWWGRFIRAERYSRLRYDSSSSPACVTHTHTHTLPPSLSTSLFICPLPPWTPLPPLPHFCSSPGHGSGLYHCPSLSLSKRPPAYGSSTEPTRLGADAVDIRVQKERSAISVSHPIGRRRHSCRLQVGYNLFATETAGRGAGKGASEVIRARALD